MLHRRLSPLLGVVLSGTLALASAPARADVESDAKDLFTRGRELRAQGDCGGAAELFRKAVRIFPSGLGSLRNLAECEESLGRWASSRRAWLDLKRALFVTHDPKYAGWDKDSEDGAARLALKVAKLRIDVTAHGPTGDAPPDRSTHLEVLLNGETLDRALLGTEIERDPGRYRIRVQGDDVSAPVEQAVDLSAGDARKVSVRVTLRAPEPAAPAGGTVPPAIEDTGKGARTAGWIILGVGSASLVAAGVSLIVRQTALADLSRDCPNYSQNVPCGSGVSDVVSRGKVASTLVDAFGIAGILAVGGGIGLVLINAPASAHTGFAVKARLAGIDAEWRF